MSKKDEPYIAIHRYGRDKFEHGIAFNELKELIGNLD